MGVPTGRFWFFRWVFFGLIAVLIARITYLQFFQHHFYKTRSAKQLEKVIRLNPNRGNIYDRNRVPLALGVRRYSAYAVPRRIADKGSFAYQISALVGLTEQEIRRKIDNQSYFVWLKRKLTKETYLKLKALDLKGLDFIFEDQRRYPHGDLAAHILGFVGIDNQGLGGLEYRYNPLLTGVPGKVFLEGDPSGRRIISGQRRIVPPLDGGHIVTTLDETIQYSAQKHLADGVRRNGAKSGQVIVMNPKTGDILAMADYPGFNPNQWTSVRDRTNSCITDVYEPGSILKIMTLAAVVEENIAQPETVVTVPERITFAGRLIREAHKRKEGETDQKSVADILKESLNVGTTLLAKELGEDRLYRYLRQFGFGQKLGIELPGESAGILRTLDQWSGVDIAMHSFGQGIAVTPLQMAAAVSTIANGGVMVKPRIVKNVEIYHKKVKSFVALNRDMTYKAVPIQPMRRVVSEETAQKMLKMMATVVETGTGTPAKIKGYSIGGKTGTAQKARKDGRGYEEGAYIASFIGVLPVEDPELVILVVVDTPKKSIWGSTVAGPVFRNIARDAVDYYRWTPSQI